MINERELWEYLLGKNGVAKTGKIAVVFKASRYEVGRIMGRLREKGLVKWMRANTWRVDEKAIEQIKRLGCRSCDECIGCFVQ